MIDAFARIGQALGGALVMAERLFDAIPASFQMVVSAGAVLLVVKYFIAPIVGVSSVLGGASDQVKVSKGIDRRSMAKSARKGN